MIIPPDLLCLLRCPATGQTLSMADDSALEQANARRSRSWEESRGEHAPALSDPFTAALVRADRTVLYPIRNGIPVLLIEEAVPL